MLLCTRSPNYFRGLFLKSTLEMSTRRTQRHRVLVVCTLYLQKSKKPKHTEDTDHEQVLSPTMLGHPHSRPRRYTIMTKNSTCHLPLGFSGIHEFMSAVVSDCDIYFNASSSEEKAYMQSLMEEQHHRGVSWRQLLNNTQRQALEAYENMVDVKRMLASGYHVVADLNQNPGHMKYLGRNLPCLLRNAAPWNISRKRPMLPLEIFRVQLRFGSYSASGTCVFICFYSFLSVPFFLRFDGYVDDTRRV